MGRQPPWSYVAVVLLVSFPLHFAWEWVQCQPFFVHQATSPTVASMVIATLGDLVLTLIAYAAVAALHGPQWPLGQWRWRPVVTLELVALAEAMAVELYAVATGRWSYTDAAPLLSLTDVSVLPILQLVLLLPASFLLARYLWQRMFQSRAPRSRSALPITDTDEMLIAALAMTGDSSTPKNG